MKTRVCLEYFVHDCNIVRKIMNTDLCRLIEYKVLFTCEKIHFPEIYQAYCLIYYGKTKYMAASNQHIKIVLCFK